MAVPHGMRFDIDHRATIADPSEKERDESIAVEVTADMQPVPPEAVGNLPFRPAVLKGLAVQPRAEASGQARCVVRAIGLRGESAKSAAA